MRVWLELTQQEGEKLFGMVKDFTVDRLKTAAMGAPKEDVATQGVQEENEPEASMEIQPGDALSDTKIETAENIPIEKVRALLAVKSQGGKQPQVKALITKFGANKLTDIDPACYAQLLAEAGVL